MSSRLMEPPACHPCPLCDHARAPFFWRDRTRSYFQCPRCALIFVDPADLPAPEAERARYETHNNSPEDAGYVAFLQRFAAPFAQRLGPTPQRGLDFGCGPGPALHPLLEARGHTMALYDPFFAPDASVLTGAYDFITCTEVFEHFHAPGLQWRRLLALLGPGGHLGIMTRLVPDLLTFRTWRYREDFTHVSFFFRETFSFLAHRDGLQVEFVDWDIVLLQKNAPWVLSQFVKSDEPS